LSFRLHRAARDGDIALAQELLEKGADLNAPDHACYTPLMYALESAAAPVEMVRLLLDRGGTVADTPAMEGNVVSFCLRGGDPRKLALVIERGADIHYTRGSGYTAILDAVFSGVSQKDPRLLELLQMLIDRGVALNTTSSYGESALRVLSRLGRFDAVRLLLDAGADESQLEWTPLHRAVALGTLHDVRSLIEEGAPLEPLTAGNALPGTSP
jgi:ankyrin repeat protein